MSVIVKYNDQTLSPTPLVNRNIVPINYGDAVPYGYTESITLNGFLTSIVTTGSLFDIVNVFSGDFKTLEVFGDGGGSLYKWDNVVVEDITFPQSTFNVGAFTPYSVKLTSYNIPNGVIDPSNEYSFIQNQDNTIDVTHKVSAKGIKTNVGALNNAIAFVKTFTGKNPYIACSPAFVTNGSGLRMSIAEQIDRQACTYSITENYKYASGLNPYIETTTLTVNDNKTADYTLINLDLKWQGSTIDKDLNGLQDALTGYNLNTVLSNYGIGGTTYLNAFTVNQNSGDSSITIKAEYLSGVSNDYSGFFDYIVSIDKDLVTSLSSWKVDGEFICKGPISFRKTRVAAFKAANNTNAYLPYLKGLITTSALFSNYGTIPLNPIADSLTINENTGLATLKLSASFNDSDSYGAFIRPKYAVNIEPAIWQYQSLPAANIEGHYIIQDLQMKKQAKINLTFDGETAGMNANFVNSGYSFINILSGIYAGYSFLVNDTITTGITNINISTEILGQEAIQTDINNSKVYGSIVNDFTRQQGFKWGF